MDLSTTLITTRSLPVSHYLRPTVLLRTLWAHRELIRQLTWRNVLARYRGSALGLAWSFVFPLLMLTVYTFVFGVVLKAKWGNTTNSSMISVALTLYSGLLVYGLFAETLGAAPTLILGNPNYVKKVVFPLEILPVCSLGAAMVQFLAGIAVLLIGSLVFAQQVSATLYWFPLVVLPLAMLSAGLAWFLASLGVYVRDIGQFIGVALQMLMFLSPIFYTLEQVPPGFRKVMLLNPLTPIVQSARAVLLWGQSPDWGALLSVTLISAVAMQGGYVWFMKTRRGFADVL
ncbi:MAG TPA: ABC transporter permease [Phycisphaerae bacterium]|jgi:lipopolysaccharide transport system permease protein|nr:ABC transporter permease [Phycisphaerae bacterium]HOB76845.1 ABC transporter permease [Phycisphaerae bacterium]HOJ53465.1 ABC transporter permease [Phycisphaerae bacterium]HOL25412.1 ABC transporter permease [Phycisphaerae bacterium]HPP19912.1 ABC transporter permease [Phycisphaerae bacterium]